MFVSRTTRQAGMQASIETSISNLEINLNLLLKYLFLTFKLTVFVRRMHVGISCAIKIRTIQMKSTWTSSPLDPSDCA